MQITVCTNIHCSQNMNYIKNPLVNVLIGWIGHVSEELDLSSDN